jgi:hypothetical protein
MQSGGGGARESPIGAGFEWATMPEKPPNLGTGYIEAVLLDSDGEETTDKRILFPN